ncbi:hypothetical protein XELAEV_180023182mg, partial [Xenopus laevis]
MAIYVINAAISDTLLDEVIAIRKVTLKFSHFRSHSNIV